MDLLAVLYYPILEIAKISVLKRDSVCASSFKEALERELLVQKSAKR